MEVVSRRMTQKEAQWLSISLIGASLCCFLLMNFITQGTTATTVLFTDINDNYMDFFHSLIDASCTNPYTERHVIYPPLCYVLYELFGHMIPVNYYSSGAFYIRGTLEGMLSFGCYLFLSISFLCIFTVQFARKLHVYHPWLIIMLMLSAPVLFAVQRGNFIMLTVACLIGFLCYHDDSSRAKRHLSFFLLSIAANIKIYPAVFGLLLVSNRRWRDCFTCIIYGLVLFLIPMLHYGGLSNISVLIDNIVNTTGRFNIRLGTRVDVDCLFAFLSAKGVLNSLFSPLQGKTLLWGTGLLVLCYACMDTEWKRILCLTIICTFIPGFSYMYNLLYLLPLFLVALRYNKHLMLLLILATLIYYPIDISSLSWIQVEGATLLPRLWDLIASFVGLFLIGYAGVDAVISFTLRSISNKRIVFHMCVNRQIMFNARANT